MTPCRNVDIRPDRRTVFLIFFAALLLSRDVLLRILSKQMDFAFAAFSQAFIRKYACGSSRNSSISAVHFSSCSTVAFAFAR